jgi:tetratricopeptide (TPR) repeat protein
MALWFDGLVAEGRLDGRLFFVSSINEALKRLNQGVPSPAPAEVPPGRPALPRRSFFFWVACFAVVLIGGAVMYIMAPASWLHWAPATPTPQGPSQGAMVHTTPPPAAKTAEPAFKPPSTAREFFERGREAQERGDAVMALAYYQRAAHLDPELAEAFLNMGNVYYFQQEDIKQAEEMYQTVLKLDPSNKMAHNNMGVIHLTRGELEDAGRSFLWALDQDDQYVDALYNLACLSARQGRESLAMAYLMKAGRLRPEVRAWAAGDEDLKALGHLSVFKRFTRATLEQGK